MLAHDSKPSMLLRQPGQMGPMGTNFGTTWAVQPSLSGHLICVLHVPLLR
jgi:hypothetical protein